MARKQFTFVQALPLGRSRREQELEQAKARSHVAKVVHKRAKDTDTGYRQLIRNLPGPHGGDLVLPQVNDVTNSYEIQPAATDIQLSHEEVVVQKRLMQSGVGPIPAYLSLCQGNSDPFTVFAIPVDSKTNALMKYTREFYLPTLARDPTNPDLVMRPEEWTECINLLKDTCTAYAHLARVAAFMSQTGHWDRDVVGFMSQPSHWGKNDELARQALEFKGKGTSLLRERIENGTMDHNTLLVIYCLLAAEIYAQNFTAAKIHVRILGQLFPTLKIPVDYNLLQNVLRLDSTMAVMHLTRPSFDLETWIPEVFAPHFNSLIESLPESISLAAINRHLDGSMINDDKLKDLIVRLRQALLLYLFSLSNPIYGGIEYKTYVRHTVYINMARFVNRYLDAEQICQDQITFDAAVIGRAQVQAYSSLSAILWCRNATTERYYAAKGAVADSEELMMTQFKEKITESEWMVLETAQDAYANTRLWALYVGAYLEHFDVARTGSRESASRAWFNMRFSRQVSAMGLVSWEHVRERLLHFLYADVLQPHGSTWFQQTIEANTI